MASHETEAMCSPIVALVASFAVSAIGADRPGIVARVTGVLADLGCNLEDTSMTILRGEFAMMLVVAPPEGLTPEALEQALSAVASELDLRVVVRSLPPGAPASPEGETWTLVVYGGDRPGIVHQVASCLAELGVNVVDLTTRLTDDGVYSMVMEIVVPAAVDVARVREAVAETSAALGVEFGLDRIDADIL